MLEFKEGALEFFQHVNVGYFDIIIDMLIIYFSIRYTVDAPKLFKSQIDNYFSLFVQTQ